MPNPLDPDRRMIGSDSVKLRPVSIKSALHPQVFQRRFKTYPTVECESRDLNRTFSHFEPSQPRFPGTRTQPLAKLLGINPRCGQQDVHGDTISVWKDDRL